MNSRLGAASFGADPQVPATEGHLSSGLLGNVRDLRPLAAVTGRCQRIRLRLAIPLMITPCGAGGSFAQARLLLMRKAQDHLCSSGVARQHATVA